MPDPMNVAQWEMDLQRNCPDMERRLRFTHIPEALRRATWDDYQDSAQNKQGESLRRILRFWADEWTPETRDGITMLGAPGLGKTLGGVLVLLQVMRAGGWVKFTTEADWIEARKALIKLERAADRSGDYEAYNAAAYRMVFLEDECDVLMMDDVGKAYRSGSGYADAALDAVFRRRVAAGKVTIVSSNVGLEDWTRFDPSMRSFLYEMGEVVVVTGKDHRVRYSRTQERRRRAQQ